LVDGGGNVIASNWFSSSTSPNRFEYGVEVTETEAGRAIQNNISGNVFSFQFAGSFGEGQISDTTVNGNALSVGGVNIIPGPADPTAGTGVAAPLGSLYLRTTGALYVKTGVGNNAWTLK
jgi:hypothetical protein